MEDINKKVNHVRSAGQTRDHRCHWPGCDRTVPPSMWGCRTHWFKLPPWLRRKVWRAYQPGQEETGKVSKEYLAVANEVQNWIRTTEKKSGKNYGWPPLLDNWRRRLLGLDGNVYGDPRFKDGAPIGTTEIVRIDEREGGLVTCRGSKYRLGKKAVEKNEPDKS